MSHKTPKIKANKDYKEMLKEKILRDYKNYKYYEGIIKKKKVDKGRKKD